MIQRTRQNLGDPTGKITVERHYFISSLAGCDNAAAECLAGYVRGHGSVENNLHDSTERSPKSGNWTSASTRTSGGFEPATAPKTSLV